MGHRLIVSIRSGQEFAPYQFSNKAIVLLKKNYRSASQDIMNLVDLRNNPFIVQAHCYIHLDFLGGVSLPCHTGISCVLVGFQLTAAFCYLKTGL